MITWIQTNFQKHFKYLFGFLLVIMGGTLALTIGNQGGFFNGRNRERLTKNFFGYDLSDQRQESLIESWARLSATLDPELVPQTARDLEKYAQFRVAGLAMADQLGIPEPTEAELKDFVRGRQVFQGQDGKFDPKQYRNAVDRLQQGSGIPEAMVEHVLKQDYRLNELRNVAGGPGFVHPYQVDAMLADQRTHWSIDTASLSLDKFDANPQPTDDDLKQFYEQNPAAFEIPERIELSAVEFPTAAFTAKVQAPKDEELQAYFEKNKARYRTPPPAPKEGETPATPPEPVFADVKDKVLADYTSEKANRLAQDKAVEYTVALWKQKAAKGSPAATELAQQMGGTVKDLPPFSRQDPPMNTGLPPKQLEDAWTLVDSERFFSDVVPTASGAAVLLFRDTIPSRQPPLDEVKDKVADAWKAQRKRELFVQKGQELHQQLQQAVADGKPFKETATGLGLDVQEYTDFTIDKLPFALRIWPGEFNMQDSPMKLAMSMKQGEVSPMRLTAGTGEFVYVAGRTVAPAKEGDETEKPDDLLAGLRKSYSTFNGSATIESVAQKRLDELEAERKKAFAE